MCKNQVGSKGLVCNLLVSYTFASDGLRPGQVILGPQIITDSDVATVTKRRKSKEGTNAVVQSNVI